MEGSFFGFPGHGQKTVRQQKRMGGQGFTVSKIKKGPGQILLSGIELYAGQTWFLVWRQQGNRYFTFLQFFI